MSVEILGVVIFLVRLYCAPVSFCYNKSSLGYNHEPVLGITENV